MDEAIHIAFLEIYFKGECEDLTKGEYETLGTEAETIFGAPVLHDWE